MASPWRRWPASCITPMCPRSTPRSVRGTCRRSTPCSGCSPSSAASTKPKRSWQSGPRRRPCCAARAAATTSGSRSPVPGDQIMGFVTRGGGVSVHRTDCTNAASLQQQAERIIEVLWAPSASSVFLVAIQVEALDRHRLLSDITRVLADEKVNILSASVTTSGDRVAISRFTFEMGDPKHLGHLLNVVRNVEGVYDVYRVTSAA